MLSCPSPIRGDAICCHAVTCCHGDITISHAHTCCHDEVSGVVMVTRRVVMVTRVVTCDAPKIDPVPIVPDDVFSTRVVVGAAPHKLAEPLYVEGGHYFGE